VPDFALDFTGARFFGDFLFSTINHILDEIWLSAWSSWLQTDFIFNHEFLIIPKEL